MTTKPKTASGSSAYAAGSSPAASATRSTSEAAPPSDGAVALVARWCEQHGEYAALVHERRRREIASDIDALTEHLRSDLEAERLRLAACGVAAMGNTPEMVAQRIAPGHPYYSASYGDVCAAVDREMAMSALAARTASPEARPGTLSALEIEDTVQEFERVIRRHSEALQGCVPIAEQQERTDAVLPARAKLRAALAASTPPAVRPARSYWCGFHGSRTTPECVPCEAARAANRRAVPDKEGTP